MRAVDAILVTLLALAFVAVVMSKNAQTANVISQFFGMITGAMQTLMKPVTGG